MGAAILLAGCPKPVSIALPQRAGDATMTGSPRSAQPPPAEWTTWRGTSSATRGWRATYSGPRELVLTLLEMSSSAQAFDAFQKWQTGGGRMAFYKGQFFGVAESAGADVQTLNAFVMGIEAVLPPGDEFRR
jgi:hypothetical protein